MAQPTVPVADWTDAAVIDGYTISKADHALLRMTHYDIGDYDKARKDFNSRGAKSRPETVEATKQEFVRTKRALLDELLALRSATGQAAVPIGAGGEEQQSATANTELPASGAGSSDDHLSPEAKAAAAKAPKDKAPAAPEAEITACPACNTKVKGKRGLAAHKRRCGGPVHEGDAATAAGGENRRRRSLI